MENNYFITSLVISIIFIIYKFFEIRYINKKNKPVKELFRESLVVFISSLIGVYLVDTINTNINKIIQPTAYTGNPDF
jgi:hypothetical protein